MKIKKIFVPFDFSDLAESALKYAHWLAKQTNATLCISHVLDKEKVKALQQLAINNPVSAKEYEEQFSETLKIHLDKAAESYAVENIRILKSIESGDLIETLLHQITEQNIDLIIMATHGNAGMFGATHTEQLLRQISIPLISIFQPYEPKAIKKIVLAVDINPTYTEVYAQIKAFQNFWSAKLCILHVVTPNHFMSSKEVSKKLERLVVDSKFENYSIETVNAYNEEEGIMFFAQKEEAELIIMITHQRSGLAHFMTGSITEEVMKQTSIPVLALGTKNISETSS